MLRALILSLVVATATVAASPAQDGRRGSKVKIAPEPAASAEAAIRDRTNAWSVGFAAGLLEGAGKVHRHHKLRTHADLERPELRALMAAALDRAP